MKKLLLLLIVAFTFVNANANEIIVSGNITSNTTWSNTNSYLLSGFVYVKPGVTLTIEPGTIVKGEKTTKGSLIVTRGGKIIADGTATQPIIFTSDQAPGERTYGDWGGLIILGNARINPMGGTAVIEGGVDNASGDGQYGGLNDNDNSGILRYVRIEYPGIQFTLNNEINGLTLGGVGSGTTIDYVMVSYSGDDAYEFFGGTVNCKHLVAYRTLDDDFDSDLGYRGNVQFAVSVRDPQAADVSGANGIETDNDGSATFATPYTTANFSNVTILGPKQTDTTTVNSNYKRGMHLKKNTRTSVFNSVFIGFPTGLLIDGAACETSAGNDSLQIRNTVLSYCNTNLAVSSSSTWLPNLTTWFNTMSYANMLEPTLSSLQLTSPTLSNPNLLPMTGSPLLSGASFSSPRLSGTFFEVVSYRGAFGTSNWTSSWTEFNPNVPIYSSISEDIFVELNNIEIYPTLTTANFTIMIDAKENTEASISILDIKGSKVVNEENVQLNSGENTFFKSLPQGLNSGIYFVNILVNGKSVSYKLIKE